MPDCQILKTGEEMMHMFVEKTLKSIHIKPRLDDCKWNLVRNSPAETSRRYYFETADRLMGKTVYGDETKIND